MISSTVAFVEDPHNGDANNNEPEKKNIPVKLGQILIGSDATTVLTNHTHEATTILIQLLKKYQPEANYDILPSSGKQHLKIGGEDGLRVSHMI